MCRLEEGHVGPRLPDPTADAQRDLAVHDGVDDIGPPLLQFQYGIGINASACQEFTGALSGDYVESQIGKLESDVLDGGPVPG